MESNKDPNTTMEDSKKIPTLAEAVLEPQKHRDMEQAKLPMPNFSSTPGAPFGLPLTFRAAWDLASRPRRIALLLDDCQEEYRPYADNILDNLVLLRDAFRQKRDENGSCDSTTDTGICIVWSGWSRTFDDGISNAMDRWYGSRGLRPENPENAVYIFNGASGMEPIKEIAPNEKERAEGWFYKGRHLDMFWNFDENGRSYLDEKLKSQHIDTVVIAGLWTDECIVSTAFAAFSRGYDVIVVSDATATATSKHEAALDVISGVCCKVVSTKDILDYLENDFVLGEAGAVKGTQHPDGRID